MNADRWQEETWKKVTNYVDTWTVGSPGNFVSLSYLSEYSVNIITTALTDSVDEMIRNNSFSRHKELEIIIDLHDRSTEMISEVIKIQRGLHQVLEDVSGERLGYDHPMATTVQIVNLQVANVLSRVQQVRQRLSSEHAMRANFDLLLEKTEKEFKELSGKTNIIADRAASLSLTGIFWGVGGFIIGITAYFFMLTTTIIKY